MTVEEAAARPARIARAGDLFLVPREINDLHRKWPEMTPTHARQTFPFQFDSNSNLCVLARFLLEMGKFVAFFIWA